MGQVNLTKSEQDFYESTIKQINTVIANAQTEAKNLLTQTVSSICESHDSEVPEIFEPVKNKKGKVIAMLWGDDIKKFHDGELTIADAVVPPKAPAPPVTPPAKPVEGAGTPAPAAPTQPAP